MKWSAFISQGRDGLSRPKGLWGFPDLHCMLSAPAPVTEMSVGALGRDSLIPIGSIIKSVLTNAQAACARCLPPVSVQQL